MQYTIGPARRLAGELRVPGELEAAAQALVLAAVAEGESRIEHVPPAIGEMVGLLRALGVEIEACQDVLKVRGRGLRAFEPAPGRLEIKDPGPAAALLAVALAGQSFATRLRVEGGEVMGRALAEVLRPMGFAAAEEAPGLFVLGGAGKPEGVLLEAAQMAPALKSAALCAGLYARGTTVLREAGRARDRAERPLRARQVEILRHQAESGWVVEVEGGQVLRPLRVELPGDLQLAAPLLAAPLALKGSELCLRHLALRPGRRAFVDLLRRLGAEILIEDEGDGTSRLRARSSRLKATRLEGRRMEKVVGQIALLAVLATRMQGECILRDLESLRRGECDFVAHLVSLLRRIGAKVGEYPQGLVVEGGYPLKGAHIETRGDAGLARAFAVAGLWAESEMEIEGVEGLEGIHPGFFAALEALKEKR